MRPSVNLQTQTETKRVSYIQLGGQMKGKAVFPSLMKDTNLIQLNKRNKVVSIDYRQQKQLRRIIHLDTQFLASLGIMDYSLFLVVEKNRTFEKKQKIKNELLVKKQERHRNMYLSPNLEELYHVGIIDWLQLWDFNKKSEVLLKVLFKNKEKKGLSARPPQEYSQRFEKYMMENVF